MRLNQAVRLLAVKAKRWAKGGPASLPQLYVPKIQGEIMWSVTYSGAVYLWWWSGVLIGFQNHHGTQQGQITDKRKGQKKKVVFLVDGSCNSPDHDASRQRRDCLQHVNMSPVFLSCSRVTAPRESFWWRTAINDGKCWLCGSDFSLCSVLFHS